MEMVTMKPIHTDDVFRLLDTSDAGSAVFHFAVVRGATDGKEMDNIEFKAAKDTRDIMLELRSISAEIKSKWDISDMLMIRAIGKMNTGDVMALVAASSPHREAAFAGCSYGVERLKKMKSIVKQETFKEAAEKSA